MVLMPEMDERRLAFDALSLEYNSMRSELVEKTTKNTQIITLLGAAAVTLGTLASTQKADWADWPLAIVAAALLVLAIWGWALGRYTIGKISAHIAKVEEQINVLVSGARDTKDKEKYKVYLNWETAHQNRPFPSWVFMGKGSAQRFERS